MKMAERDNLLSRMDERLKKIEKCLANHLHMHQLWVILAFGTAISAIGALILVVWRQWSSV